MTRAQPFRARENGPPYAYGLLDPHPEASNPLLDGEFVLGVEVTVPELAERCSLGNLDPQHSSPRGAGGGSARSAIEGALDAPLPPVGTVLVTIRPDLDSIGAMALLTLRRRGEPSAETIRRVREIGCADAGPRGEWPGRFRTDPSSDPALALLRSVVGDARLTLEERVATLRAWLETGLLPEARAEKTEDALRETPDDLGIYLSRTGSIAVVHTSRAGATGLGYRYAPVVIAENPRFKLAGGPPHRKVTVAQYSPGWFDMGAVLDELAALEPGWGGSETICGSPQGRGTELSLARVLAAVERHMLAAGRARLAASRT